MRKVYLFLFSCCVPMLAAAQQRAQLSPLTRAYLHGQQATKNEIVPGYVYNRGAGGQVYISALVKVSDATAAQSGLDALSAHVGTKAGSIWTVKVPIDRVRDFAQVSGISYIQLDEPLRPALDVARKTTRVDSVHGGYALPMPYTGKDVVVGVIDFGFDYNHPTFYDTLHGAYRIRQVWEMGGSGPAPSGYAYGREITDTNAIKAEGTDNAHESHGTCTSGMAAGSGYGSAANNRRFRGMAFDADLVMVGVRRDSIGGQWMQGSFSDFLDGVKYIFNYAASVGKPAVVNISWGSQSGSHDGTSLFNQACDELSGSGKIIVMSAGNEGTEKIHLSKTFTATDTTIKTFLTFTPSTYRRTWVDIWGQASNTFCAKATLYSGGVAGATTGYVCTNDTITNMYLIGANGIDTCFVQFISSHAEATNGKPRTTVNIFNKATDSVGISVAGTSGTIDMWDEYYYYGFPYQYQSAFDSLGNSWAVSGNTVSTVSDMGSAASVLLVGAYCSKNSFVDINGHNWSYSSYVSTNRLVPFSSRGPMIDGRIKPDITAPGLTIATSMTSYDSSYTATGSNSSSVIHGYTDPATSKTYYYAEFSGTSASAPAASGIVALMLQANPTLTPGQVKTIIINTAITDAYTGTLPSTGTNDWGHGKINAYGALKQVVQLLSVYQYHGQQLDCVLFPNPNTGSFTIDYTAPKAEQVILTVYNTQGGLVYMQPWQTTAGSNTQNVQLPSGIAKGVYIVKLVAPTGTAEIKAMIR